MAIKTLSYRKWLQIRDEVEATSGDPDAVPNGYSPGGAAVELGVTRDAVHKAIRRGKLDAYHVPAPGGRPGYYLIPQAAIDAYKLAHQGPHNGPYQRVQRQKTLAI